MFGTFYLFGVLLADNLGGDVQQVFGTGGLELREVKPGSFCCNKGRRGTKQENELQNRGKHLHLWVRKRDKPLVTRETDEDSFAVWRWVGAQWCVRWSR